MKKGLIVGAVVIAALMLLMFLFRTKAEIVIVERMIDFEQAEPGSRMEWTDRNSVRAFEYGFRFARKEPGVVDIAAPPYAVTLGEERYFLYIYPSSEQVQFLKADNTGTLYTMKKSSGRKLKELISEADDRFGVAADGAANRDVEELTAIDGGSSSLEPASPSPDVQISEPFQLDVSLFTEEERPLIELINSRTQYLYEGDLDGFLSLYTEAAREARSGSDHLQRLLISHIEVSAPITIKEQRSLFEAVVTVKQTREGNDENTTFFVFHKGKEADDQWLIADVD